MKPGILARWTVFALAVLLTLPVIVTAQDAQRIAQLTARPTLTRPEQEELAKALFQQMASAKTEDQAFYEKTYGIVMEKCPDTDRAHESYWRLTNLYLRAYDTPQYARVVRILEQFLSRYKTSTVLSMKKYADDTLVFSPIKYLHQAYEELDQYDKIAAYYDAIAAQAATFAIYDLFDYAKALDKLGRAKDAIAWYGKFVERTKGNDSVDFMREIAADRIKELQAKK